MKNVKAFVLDLYNGDGSFAFSPNNRISNLYSTCFAVMCLDLIGELNTFLEKDKVINLIQDYQDKDSGFFLDDTAIPKEGANHDQKYIQLQLTDFAQLALSAFDVKPKYKYEFLSVYKDKDYLKKWFFNLNWSNPWLVSNEIMFILNCLIYEDEEKNREYVKYIINLLNKSQDLLNGYWNLGKGATLHNQMAGAYHFMFFYTYLDLSPNNFEKIIDSTLKIQDRDGLFNYSSGGGSCDDLDAIDLLCRGTFYTKHRHKEIQKALMSSYASLLKNQNEDRGFCWAKRSKNLLTLLLSLINLKLSSKDFVKYFLARSKRIYDVLLRKEVSWKYSGLESMKLHNFESDLFSTWFRLTSIGFIERTFPEICQNKESVKWNLRTKCGLGFYKKAKK
jgi:hypothetical protein